MSHNSPQPKKFVVTGRSMVIEADSEEEAVNRAQDASGWHWEAQEITPERQFEARGSVTIEYAMAFSEAEARAWFPDVAWDDPDRSHAGDIETDHLLAAPKEFWDSVRTKRRVVIDTDLMERTGDGVGDGMWRLADEITAVVEL